MLLYAVWIRENAKIKNVPEELLSLITLWNIKTNINL